MMGPSGYWDCLRAVWVCWDCWFIGTVLESFGFVGTVWFIGTVLEPFELLGMRLSYWGCV